MPHSENQCDIHSPLTVYHPHFNVLTVFTQGKGLILIDRKVKLMPQKQASNFASHSFSLFPYYLQSAHKTMALEAYRLKTTLK